MVGKMKDEDKTKEQLLRELKKARKRITELETIEIELKGVGEKRVAALKMAVDMIEDIPAGVVITDMEGKIVDLNKAMTEQTGYTREDVVGKTPLEVGIGKGEMVKVLDSIIKLFSGESVRGAEYHVIRKDGSEFPVIVDISVIKDTEGNPISGIVVLKDITERERMEQQLEERKLTILRMIANGTTTSEIAARLSLSEATIKRDVRDILDTFNVRNRSEAVAEAYKRNLI
jgi:PAS domain S-box-containing protein